MADVKKCLQMEKAAPPLTDAEMQKLNALFPAYIFRRRKTREIWTSCCGVYGQLPADSEIMYAEHTREPEPRRYLCHNGAWAALPPKPKPEPAVCPFCGKVAPVKELGRTGKRDNLAAYGRAVVLRWYRGALWVRCYKMAKKYRGERELTARPAVWLTGIYRFTPGKVEKANKHSWIDQWAGHKVYETAKMPAGFKIPEPFTYNTEYGMGYDVIGLEEAGKSPFRWCCAEEFEKKHPSALMGFLGVCTKYPRQVEMLMKTGLDGAVYDLVVYQKKNSRVFNWDEENPLRSFGMSKEEMKQFLAGDKDLDLLACCKSLRRAKVAVTIPELCELRMQVGQHWFSRVTARMRRYGISISKIQRYLEQVGEGDGEKKPVPISTVAGWWCDYIDAAQMLGLDLKNQVFLMPKDLKWHHDLKTKAAELVRAAKRGDEATRKGRERMQALSKRYTYSDGRYLIRPPSGAAEIVAEGKALKHCVGGYADRHIQGKTTILFLRDRKKPGKSLVTVEMNGKNIVQIHGWDDERTACKANPERKDPRELYAEFLDPWLAWLAAGSKRDKKGRPKLPKEKKHAGAA